MFGFDVDYNVKDESFVQFKIAQTLDNELGYNQNIVVLLEFLVDLRWTEDPILGGSIDS